MEAVDNPSYFRVMGAAGSAQAHAQPETRRSFRSLLRSLSAHDRVPQRLLVRGEPRPADKAPAQGDRAAFHTHRAATQPRRRSGHHHPLGATDMVYCATPDTAAGAPTGDTRYYNLTMPMASRRRHSIGAFLKSSAASLSTASTHAARAAPAPARATRAAKAGEKIYDVVIISSLKSRAATTWVEYLQSCFQVISRQKKRRPYRVLTQNVETLEVGSTTAARLQVVMVCPELLSALGERPRTLENVISADRALAMMLVVREDDLTVRDKAALPNWTSWSRCEVRDQDKDNVAVFLEHAVRILSASSRRAARPTDKPTFSLTPKKVKEGQNKVLVLLDTPAAATDTWVVSVLSGGTVHEVTNVKHRNPYTLSISVPPTCMAVSNIATVSVSQNGVALGNQQIKCESRMRELEQMLRSFDNPLQLMYQTLGFNDREQLDNFLVTAFQRNIPPHFNLLHSPQTPTRGSITGEGMPTLLHFAATHGLERLAWQLLECPGGEAACDIRNSGDLTPAELAEQAGHTRLAGQLRGFMQMNEFSNMYSYMRVMSEGANAENLSGLVMSQEAEYSDPRPISQTYQVPRFLALPVMQNMKGQTTHGHSPMNDYQVPRSSEEDYQVPRCQEDDYQVPPPPRAFSPPHYMEMNAKHAHQTSPALTFDIGPLEAVDKALREEGRAESRNAARGTDEELADIIKDFKNQVVTITEVERLVASWQNRHETQQSFKEKQEQLAAMREQYDFLQSQLKGGGKAATPFDRIRRFFRGRGKGDVSEPVKEEAPVQPQVKQPLRPGSSLSLHSICSSTDSGRMSTVSASSFGDSGTHSDSDDRNRYRSLVVPNYYAPDVPSIQERPPVPLPRPSVIDDVDYIEPDNVPRPTAIHQPVDNEAEYLDISDENNSSNLPEYMNFTPPSLPPRR